MTDVTPAQSGQTSNCAVTGTGACTARIYWMINWIAIHVTTNMDNALKEIKVTDIVARRSIVPVAADAERTLLAWPTFSQKSTVIMIKSLIQCTQIT
jgi:hypothetical protein